MFPCYLGILPFPISLPPSRNIPALNLVNCCSANHLKFSISILLIYLVSLAVIPCCAFDDCKEDQKMAENRQIPGDDKKSDCGACSPFFHCEKCASSTITVNGLSFTTGEFAILSIYSEFIPSRLRAIYLEFWKPPRYC
jgi:hypothetical protein